MKPPLGILVVEDEVLIARCLRMELKQAGYEICQRVATGEDAVNIAQHESPDIILMDIRSESLRFNLSLIQLIIQENKILGHIDLIGKF